MRGDRAAPDQGTGRLGGRSRWADVDGPVHYLDFGGPASGPLIVCVHGLGGSAVNWSAIAPRLTRRFRLVAPDLAGFGLTRASGRDADVTANRVLLHRFIQSLPAASGRLTRSLPTAARGRARPVILMGNSMGGMISLLEASAAPDAVSHLILIDPALPVTLSRPDPAVAALLALYSAPGLGGLLMSRRRGASPEAQVARILSLCCADPSRVAPGVVDYHLEVERRRADYGEDGQAFTAAMRSVVAMLAQARGQAYRAAAGSVTCPVLLVHGARDRLVPVAAARAAARANPSWSLVILPGVGHVPQLEAPDETARVISDWLGRGG